MIGSLVFIGIGIGGVMICFVDVESAAKEIEILIAINEVVIVITIDFKTVINFIIIVTSEVIFAIVVVS